MGILRRDDDSPRCPYCKWPSDNIELTGHYETITCKKCGRNFYAKMVKVFETVTIEI